MSMYAIAVLGILGVAQVAHGGELVPRDVVSSDTCKDIAVKELVTQGHVIPCFSAFEGSLTYGECTISGVCKENIHEQHTPIPRWRTFSEEINKHAVVVQGWVLSAIDTFQSGDVFGEVYTTVIRPFGARAQTIDTKSDMCTQKPAWWVYQLLPAFSRTPCPENEVIVDMDENVNEGSEVLERVQTPAELTLLAFPETVRLQGRSTLLWAAEHVQEGSCTVTGLGFKASGDSGQGSTIALSEDSLFTLQCLNLSNEPVSVAVLVSIGS